MFLYVAVASFNHWISQWQGIELSFYVLEGEVNNVDK